MKLIDVLAQELPKKSGWPYGAIQITQDEEGELCCWQKSGAVCIEGYWKHPDGNGLYLYMCNEYATRRADDRGFSIVTREQYEAALVASQQPVWNGEGLPPVGTICEALAPVGKGELWSWQRVKVVESGIDGAEKECLVYNLDTTCPSWVDEFRPIRTESERRREDAINEIASLIGRGTFCEDAAGIYDAIAAGKIRGVKLEASDE